MQLLSSEEYKKLIMQETPGLAAALTTKEHLQVTTLLREYAYKNHIWSNDGLNLLMYGGQEGFGQLQVNQIAFLFLVREIGVLSRGVAHFLVKLYELFGYPATLYDYGIRGLSDHVATLVAIPNGVKEEIICQDATFNFTYSLKNTGERAFRKVIGKVLSGQTDDLIIEKGKIENRDIYFSNNSDGRLYIEIYQNRKVLQEEPQTTYSLLTNTPILFAKGDLDFHSNYTRRNGANVLKGLADRLGKPEEECQVIELMAFPLGHHNFQEPRLQEEIHHLWGDLAAGPQRPSRKLPDSFTLREYDLSQDNGQSLYPPPEPTGWERGWHGYYVMSKTFTPESRRQFKELFTAAEYDSFILELFTLLRIMEEYAGRQIHFMELGSGRAPWCLTVAGAIKFKLVHPAPRSCRVLALDAEPHHYQWSRDHLGKQQINAEVVYGAIADRVGTCRFQADTDPVAHMGQAVKAAGNIAVPAYTIDYLCQWYCFDRIDIIHMDVQGCEVDAIRGAAESIRAKLIDYFIIGTHSPAIEKELKVQLQDTYDLIIELPIHQTRRITGINKLCRSTDDGVHVYRRKDMSTYIA